MAQNHAYDAVVVGSGPNGLSASTTLAREGLSVLLVEARETVGGGTRSGELTEPGFLHDICSAIHPMGAASPFFRSLDIASLGVEWVYPPVCVAHPLDDGTAALLLPSVDATAATLGPDAAAYRRLMAALLPDWERIISSLLGPVRAPRHPWALLRFGALAVRSALGLAQTAFESGRGRALFAGLGAHSIMPLERPFTAAYGLVLGLAGHAVGWPLVRGGSQRIADGLAHCFTSLGGRVVTGMPVASIDDLPEARVVLLDLTPRQLLRIAGDRLPATYRGRLEAFRYGPGVFKLDWALDSSIPWKARECSRAGTVHLGGMMEEIAEAERAVWDGEHPERPFVILAQQSLFDPTRAAEGKHTAWAYCHVPRGTDFDMTERIEAQVERFAPGFRDRVLARSAMSPLDMECYNPNYVGGDIAGGAQDFWQLFLQPALRRTVYSTPARGLYLCSSSTPPGAGVHGMCGYHAARVALRDLRRRPSAAA